MRRASSLFGLIALVVGVPNAHAWYDHTVVMDGVQKRLEAEFPQPGAGPSWNTPLPADSTSPVDRFYEIASLLLLQSRAADLPSKNARTLHDLLSGLVVVRRDALSLTGPDAAWNMRRGGFPQA